MREKFWWLWRIGKWCLFLLLGLSIPMGYLLWKATLFERQMFGFQPLEMALAQYTSKDVIGNLGGVKVRIPRACAEYVEYDGDPRFGEQRKGKIPERNSDSRLSSFGIDARFPEMTCKENDELRKDYGRLRQDNPWVSIGINAGDIYPKLGAKASAYHEKLVAESLREPTAFWFDNYEKLSGLVYGLDAYVVTGIDPNTGGPARESERVNDVFFGRDESGVTDTYIRCSRTYVSGGVATCSMSFSLEPRAKVHVSVRFTRHRLYLWRDIRQSVSKLLLGYEIASVGFEPLKDKAHQDNSKRSLK